jgi:hypothetical protein
VAFDVGAELDRLQRALLADQPRDGEQFVGGLEAEGGWADDPAQLGYGKRLRHGSHRGDLAATSPRRRKGVCGTGL